MKANKHPEELQDRARLLEETPAVLRQLAEGLTLENLQRKQSSSEFSVLEHVCHLRDIEHEGYAVRIEKLLSENHPWLADIDGDRLAAERNYNGQDLAVALHDFTRARQENVRVIKDLSSDQLHRGGTLERVGDMTLERLLLMMCEHDRDHRQALDDLRRHLLGKNS